MAKITVLVVEDDSAARHAWREGWRTVPDIRVVGEVEVKEAEEAQALAGQLKPDVLLLETPAGLPVARQLRRAGLLAAVIVLTPRADMAEARRIFRAGGLAYCQQDIAPRCLAQVVRQVAQGHYVLDDQVFDREGLQARLAMRPGARQPARLSRRELDILEGVTQGLSNKEIALALGICHSTVKNHMTSLLGKLRAADRTQLAVYALRQGWVHLQAD